MFDQFSADDYPLFLGEAEAAEAETSFFHVVPVPLELSDTFGRETAEGPAAILDASQEMEAWDGVSNPSQLGIYTYPPVDVDGVAARALDNVASVTSVILKQGGFPVLLGGEHTITLGALKGFRNAGVKDLGVVQFDAHAGLREGNKHDHPSVMKQVLEKNYPLLQMGVRNCNVEEMKTRDVYGVHFHDAEELVMQNQHGIRIPSDFPDRCYLSLDIDVFDPGAFPTTPMPEPGGLGWYQVLHLIESIASQREIIGMDLCQFAPIRGFHAFEYSAARLIYRIMGIIERSKL
jgi:agmatinase